MSNNMSQRTCHLLCQKIGHNRPENRRMIPIWPHFSDRYFSPDISRYEQQEIALNCGTMLRECIRYEALTKILLHSDDHFYDFFKYVEVSTFDIASDAFATFKVRIQEKRDNKLNHFPFLSTLSSPFSRSFWRNTRCWLRSFWSRTTTRFSLTIRSFCIQTTTWPGDSHLSCSESYSSTDTTSL